MDGDARGGAALSIRAITQKPIKFIAVGEKNSKIWKHSTLSELLPEFWGWAICSH